MSLSPSKWHEDRARAVCKPREHALQKAVAGLLAYVERAAVGGWAVCSAADLAGFLSVSLSTAQRAMERAREKGLLDWRWRHDPASGHRTATAWRLVRVGAATVAAMHKWVGAKARSARYHARRAAAHIQRTLHVSLNEQSNLSEEYKGEEASEPRCASVKPMSQGAWEGLKAAYDALPHLWVGSAEWQEAALVICKAEGHSLSDLEWMGKR